MVVALACGICGPSGCGGGASGGGTATNTATNTTTGTANVGSSDTVLARYHATRAAADPALPHGQLDWQLPGQVRARAGYGVRADDGYAVFGVGASDPRGGDAEIGAGERARFAVLDLRTGELTVHPAVGTDRTADAAAPVADPGGRHWVVRTEAGPRPATECPATPDYCWTWTLYATELPSGDSDRIATATRPGPQFFLPQVVTDGHTTAWLDASASADGSATTLMTWQPGGTARAVARQLPVGRLSLDAGAAWIGTADRDGHRLLRVDLGTGRTTASALPAGAAEGVVTRGSVAYVHRPPDDSTPGTPTTVDVAPVTALASVRRMFTGPDVYTLNWAGAGQLILSSNSGYLITDGRAARRLDLDLLSGVHDDAGRLALVQQRDGCQVVVVVG
jgi:hypothetical protein